jgi:transcriptional regulator with XRE-family HTH domain
MSYKRSHTERDPFPDTPRNIRLDAGLKTRHIAAMSGRPISVIGRLETQRSNPQVFTLAQFYAACGRPDLFNRLLHLLDDDKQDWVYTVYERWHAGYGPGTRFHDLLSQVQVAEFNGWPTAAGLRRRLDRLGRTGDVGGR